MITEVPNAMAPTLVLDLDGTLVDCLPDLAAALNRLMAARGLAPFTLEEMRPMVGDGAPALVARAFAARVRAGGRGCGSPTSSPTTPRMSAVATRPYPGRAGHAAARSRRRAGAWRSAPTSPSGRRAPCWTRSASARSSPRSAAATAFPCASPIPAHLLATLRAAGGDPGPAVMVGDHRNDVQAARGAGLPCIFAAWGYGPPAMADGADAVADRFAELPEIAARLLGLDFAASIPRTPS